jgi:hypothetical protein
MTFTAVVARSRIWRRDDSALAARRQTTLTQEDDGRRS